MSAADQRVVELQFNNGQFEAGVKQSVSSLQKLKSAMNLQSSAKSLDVLNTAARHFSLSNVVDNVQTVADRFSSLGIIGDQVLRRLTDSAIGLGRSLITAIPNQIISGGKRRAQNIEQAQFQLKGLLQDKFDWDKISEDLDYAVSGTAYGLDAAAKAAAQLRASNIDFGDDMKQALRGISGAAAMTNSSYEDIAHIFTTVAGQGKLMSDQLQSFASRGLNVAATLAEKYKVSEQELRKMVSQGKIDFKTFARYMNEAFGEQATKANDTFTGALSNVKAALSRMGAQFATPAYENLRRTLVALIPVLKDIEKFLKPISARFKEIAENVSGNVVGVLENLHATLAGALGLEGGDFSGPVENVTKAVTTLRQSMSGVLAGFGSSADAAKGFGDVTVELEKTNKVYEAAEKAYEEIEKKAKEYIANGKDEALVNKQKADALKNIKRQLEMYTKSIDVNVNENNKLSKGEQARQQLLKKSAETAVKLRDKVFKLFGIEKQENEQVKENKKEYEGLEDIVQDVILGKFGNGEERVKKLEELGLSYAIIQNKVNELLGVEKRHEVTAEDEAKMAKYLGKSLGDAGEEAKKSETIFQKVVNVLAGIGAAMSIVKNAGTALIQNIIVPLVSWGVPRLLNLILTPLSAIGKKLVELNKNLIDSDYFNVKFKAIADGVKDLKTRIGQLEGPKRLAASFERLKTVLGELKDKILGSLSKRFSDISKSIKMPGVDFFLGLLDTIANKLADFIDYLLDHRDSIAGFFAPIKTVATNVLKGLGDGISFIFKSLTGGEVQQGMEGVAGFINFLGQVAGKLGSGAIKALMMLGDGLGKAFKALDLNSILNLIAAGGFAKIVTDLGVLSNGLATMGVSLRKGGLAGLLQSFSGVFGNLSLTLVKMQNQIRAKTLIALAIAVAILAGSLLVLASIDPDRMMQGVAGVSALLGELVVAFNTLDKSTMAVGGKKKFISMGIALLVLALAVGSLTGSLVKLSKLDWNGIFKGLAGVGGLLTALVIVTKNIATGQKGIIATAIGMLLLAIAVKKLAKAMTIIAKLSWEEIAKGLTGVIGALLALVMAMNLMPTTSMLSTAVGVLLISMSLKSMVKAVQGFAGMEWGDLAKGIIGLGMALLMVAGIMSLMPEAGMVGAAVGVMIIAMALKSLVKTMTAISQLSWEDVVKSLVAICGVLLEISLAALLLSGERTFAGAVAILVIAAAINALVPAMQAISSLSWEGIIKALVGLAGGFVVLWAGALLLSSVSLVLLKLAGAFLLFGVGAAAAGVGMTLLVGALVTLAASANFIVNGVVTAIVGIFGAIIESAAKIVGAIKTLLVAVISAFEEVIPLFVTVGFSLLLCILRGVRDNIGEIVEVATEIVVRFIAAINKKLPELVNAGLSLLINLINSLANSIRSNSGPLFSAIQNLVMSLVGFLITALQTVVGLIPGIGTTLANGLGAITASLQSSFGTADGTKSATDYINGIIDGLTLTEDKKEEIKTKIGTILEELRHVDGSAFSIGIENLQAYIEGLDLPDDEEARLVRASVDTVVDMAEEDFSVAVYNLKYYIHNLLATKEEQEHLMGLVEDAVNAGPIGEFGVRFRELRAFINNLDISDEAKENVRTIVEEGALANAKYKIALKNIQTILSGYGMPLSTYQDIQDFIQGFVANKTFDVSMSSINAIIDENASASMSLWEKIRLKSMIQDAASTGMKYNVTMASLKLFLSQEGINIPDSEIAKVEAKISQIGTMLAQGVEEDEEGNTVETLISELKVKLGTFTYVHGQDSNDAIDKLIEDAINKKKNYEIALNNVKIKLQAPTDEHPDSLGWSEDAITRVQEAIETLSKGDPEHPYTAELEKIWLECSNYDMTPQSKLDLLTDISDGLEGALREKFLIDSLELALTDEGISEPVAEQIKTKMKELLGSGVTQADALYTEIINYIRENVKPEEQGTAEELVDQVINKGGNTTIAKLTQLGIVVEGDVKFATDAARDYWVGRVQNLLSIAKGEGGPIELPVAISRFLLDLEKSGLLESDKAIISRTANEIINAWSTYYDEGYIEIYKRQEAARKQLLGGAYAYDQASGMLILKGTELAKAWDEYWSGLEFDESNPEEVEKVWKGFSQFLFDKNISKEQFAEGLAGLDPVTQQEILDKVFPAEGTWGSDPLWLQQYFEDINHALRTGASDTSRFKMMNEGRMDFTKLIFGDSKPDYSEVTQYTNDFYEGLEKVMIEDADGNRSSIEDLIRKEYGKDAYEPLSAEEIIGYLFTPDAEHGYARDRLREYGYANLIIDAMRDEIYGAEGEVEGSLEDWIAKLAEKTPVIEKQFDAQAHKTYESIWDSAQGWQKEFILNMKKIMNPENIPDEDMPSYMEWLERAMAEWGITDSKGNKLTLQKLFAESDPGSLDYNDSPYAILVSRISQAFAAQSPVGDKSMMGRAGANVNMTALMEEFPGLKEFYEAWEPGSEDEIASDIEKKLAAPFEEVDGEEVKEEAVEAIEDEDPIQSLLDKWSKGELNDAEFRKKMESLGGGSAEAILNSFDAGWSKDDILKQFSDRADYMYEGFDAGASEHKEDMEKEGEESAGAVLAGFDATGKINSPSKAMEERGMYLIQGAVIGIEKNAPLFINAIKTVAERCLSAFKEFGEFFTEAGVELVDHFASGITSGIQVAYSAAESLVGGAINGARSREYEAEELGRYFGEGYVRGLDSMREAAYEAGGALAAEAEQGNRDVSSTESPSKVAKRLGNYFGMGYVNGMMEFSKKVHDTAGDLATTAIDTLRNPMQLVQSLLDSDLETDPTITPVMDLSQIQNGVRRINGMMPDTGVNLGYISSSMNRPRTTNEDVVAAIGGLSRQMVSASGNVYNVNGITYDDGTNIATAVQDLVRAARVERRR